VATRGWRNAGRVVRMALGYAMRRVDGSYDGTARGW
jgi:hypothetical protein